MNITLIGHTQLSDEFYDSFDKFGSFDSFLEYDGNLIEELTATDGQVIALTAIRTCYSPNKPSEIIKKEGSKYFGNKATDGEGGTEADRLIRFIARSGHTSTLEHISFTFSIENVSRALLAQLTRHRVGFSFSVQSQRYVRLGSNDRSEGFNYIKPESIEKHGLADAEFEMAMFDLQRVYDSLRSLGVPPEDARSVLPNAAVTNLVMTVNLTALLSFYSKRKKGRGAQAEIAELAERLREEVVKVESWTNKFFDEV